MRHQNQTEHEQMTRLLIQKPKAFAELDEMSRMAISVLTDEGWAFSRVGMDMRVAVTSTPVIEEVESATAQANAELVQHLASAEVKFVALRARVIEAGAQQWLMAGVAFLFAAFLNFLNEGAWTVTMAPVCVICYAIARLSKKGAAR